MICRMIYDNTQVYKLFETEGKTLTKHNVFESSNINDCFDKIDELQLNFTYFSGDTGTYIDFSGGTRTISDIG